nr:unnamed protein product [Callosobruchus chinensis]
MLAVLGIIILFCCLAAPGIRGLCKRYICRTCIIDDPDLDNGTYFKSGIPYFYVELRYLIPQVPILSAKHVNTNSHVKCHHYTACLEDRCKALTPCWYRPLRTVFDHAYSVRDVRFKFFLLNFYDFCCKNPKFRN